MSGPVPVLSDCPTCRVEAAFVELVDPEDRLGVAIEGECRMCLHRLEYGLIVRDGVAFADVRAVRGALARWALEDGDIDVERFVAANFANLSVDGVAAQLLSGRRVETGFDVVAFLFPGSAGGSGGTAQPDPPSPLPATRSTDASAPAPVPDFAEGDVGRVLVSVLMADGEVRAAEERALHRLTAEMGTPEPDRATWRVWRPHEVGVPPEAGRVLAAMREVALADGEADGTEIRVLEEYARAWRVSLNRRGLRPPTVWEGVARAIAGIFSH